MKMNVPQEEAKDFIDHMGAKDMGYLFENAEKMDLQAERRNTQEAQKKLKRAEERAKTAEEQAKAAEERVKTAEEQAKAAEEKVISAENSVKLMIGNLIELCKKENLTKEETKRRLRELYKVGESDLANYFEMIWQDGQLQ